MEVSLQHCGALNKVVVQENGNDEDKNVNNARMRRASKLQATWF